MATAPWTVKTTKRKRTTDTSDLRKSRSASLVAGDQADNRARQVKQKTLTQIQWAPSRPVSCDNADLEPLGVRTEPRSRSRRRVPGLKKRDSTLTQMDFLVSRTSIEMTEQDMAPLILSKEEGTAVPQLDGNYDSPRKPRPSKTSGAQTGYHRKRKSMSALVDESQEYVPTKKRRKGKIGVDDTPVDGSLRRRSGCRAHKLPSDPAENFDVFQQALADATPTVRKPTLEIKDSTGLEEDVGNVVQPQENMLAQGPTRPILEVQDSVDDADEEIEILSASPAKVVPKTPETKRHYIPSSQSPESLPPSTRRKTEISRSTNKTTPKRNPLAELSANTPSCRHVIKDDDSPVAMSISKRKICTLKLPRIPIGSMRKRVEDSQADIWAVPPTSSPKPKGDSQTRPVKPLPVEPIEEEQPEIPSTSQVQNDDVVISSSPQPAEAETQESLQSLSVSFLPIKNTAENNDIEPQQASTEAHVEVRDFVTRPRQTPQKETQYVRFLQSQSDCNDEDDGLGSPVANDTQFVADIAHIPTSPMETSDPLKQLNPNDTMRILSSSSSENDAPASSLSAPKLVDRVEYQNSTTTIPTKNISSPILPPMPPPTQRLMAPASLPHPSQMSTQEPSQQLPQLSSVPQRSPTSTEMITIKDSSSIYENLSQLPEYNEDELQLQRELDRTQHRALEEDEDDDEDAYDDLDPKTPRKTVRYEQPPRPGFPPVDVRSPNSSLERPEENENVPDPSPPANFTQNGHVTAARIEDMRRRGLIPRGYNPPAYKVPSARELLPAWMFEDDDDEL